MADDPIIPSRTIPQTRARRYIRLRVTRLHQDNGKVRQQFNFTKLLKYDGPSVRRPTPAAATARCTNTSATTLVCATTPQPNTNYGQPPQPPPPTQQQTPPTQQQTPPTQQQTPPTQQQTPPTQQQTPPTQQQTPPTQQQTAPLSSRRRRHSRSSSSMKRLQP
ncbi:putative uncharacterized protein DDB_G0290521 [Procambarus clarkii]|uniref:putative uncharacterized protein DDB_G0290521 n=1 Tax=Procambarus clarkii TaxID=6728 RepID=UPI003743E7B4